MPTKAQTGKPAEPIKAQKEHRPKESDPVPDVKETSPDDLIMVLFPRVAWQAAQKLCDDYGGKSIGETISYALKLLEQKLKVAKEKDDGRA